MRLAIRNALRLPNYIKAFGLLGGLSAYASSYVVPRVPGELFRLNFDGHAVSLRNGLGDVSIFFQVLVKREYETRHWPAQHERLDAAYAASLDSGRTPVIIDAGANIGLASLWFANRYPRARVFAVEPDAANVELLRRNTASTSVTVLEGAIWDRPALLAIDNPDAGSAAFRVVEGQGAIRAYSVAEIVSMQAEADLFIVKIDIEGGESALFRSNAEWVADAALLVIETHDWLYPAQGTSRSFLKRIAELPVDFLFAGENVFCFRVDAATPRKLPS